MVEYGYFAIINNYIAAKLHFAAVQDRGIVTM